MKQKPVKGDKSLCGWILVSLQQFLASFLPLLGAATVITKANKNLKQK